MKSKYFGLNILITFLFLSTLILMANSIIPNKELLTRQKQEKGYIYTIEYNNRYIYYNIFNEPILFFDRQIPRIPVVYFDNYSDLEIEIVKRLHIIDNIIEINFLKNKIICYNNMKVIFFDKYDLLNLPNNKEFFNNMESGEYYLINESIIKID